MKDVPSSCCGWITSVECRPDRLPAGLGSGPEAPLVDREAIFLMPSSDRFPPWLTPGVVLFLPQTMWLACLCALVPLL